MRPLSDEEEANCERPWPLDSPDAGAACMDGNPDKALAIGAACACSAEGAALHMA
jgi:hypothetical protein